MAYSLHRQRHPEADVGNCKQDANERIRQTNNEPNQILMSVVQWDYPVVSFAEPTWVTSFTLVGLTFAAHFL